MKGKGKKSELKVGLERGVKKRKNIEGERKIRVRQGPE